MFFVAIVVVIVLVAVGKHASKAVAAWAEAARLLSWPPPPATGLFGKRRLAGKYRDFDVEVHTYTRGSGQHSSNHTRFRVQIPDLALGLRLTRIGFLSEIKRFLGDQDIEIGDQTFDKAILVKGSDPEAVRGFLTRARSARIHRFLTSHEHAEVTDSAIEFSVPGKTSSADLIVQGARDLAALAATLGAEERAEDRRLDGVLSDQSEGRITEALAGLGVVLEPPYRPEFDATLLDERTEKAEPSSVEELEVGVEEKVVEGGLLYLAGREREAKEAFRAARQAAPDDEEIREWAEQREVVVATPQPAAEPVAVDAASICLALFGPEISSFQAMRLFESDYKDRTVRWRGTLRRVEPFRFDFVLGRESGTKATVEVGSSHPTSYSETTVLAVVGLPADAMDILRDKVGESIDFEGTFVKADGFMRNLFVAGAGLVDTGAASE